MDRTWKANTVIVGWNDRPLKLMQVEDPFDADGTEEPTLRELTVLDAMLIVTNNYSCKTMEESEKKRLVKKALLKAGRKGSIVLDSSPHKWLVEIAKTVCPPVWQDNAEMVFDILSEGYAKVNPKEKEGMSDAKPS